MGALKKEAEDEKDAEEEKEEHEPEKKKCIYKVRYTTGRVGYAQSGMRPSITLFTRKGFVKGSLKLPGKGKQTVAHIAAPADRGYVKSIQLTATNRDGWYFTSFEAKGCHKKAAWVRFGCTHQWLDGLPYDRHGYSAPYGHTIHLKSAHWPLQDADSCHQGHDRQDQACRVRPEAFRHHCGYARQLLRPLQSGQARAQHGDAIQVEEGYRHSQVRQGSCFEQGWLVRHRLQGQDDAIVGQMANNGLH